jgi:hypothetical protein
MTDVLHNRTAALNRMSDVADRMENKFMHSLRSILGSSQISLAFSAIYFGLFGLLFAFGLIPKPSTVFSSALSFVFAPQVLNSSNLNWIRLYSYFYLVLGLVNWFNRSITVSRNQVTLTSIVNSIWCFHILTEFWSYKSVQLPFLLGITALCLGSYALSRGGALKFPEHHTIRQERRTTTIVE